MARRDRGQAVLLVLAVVACAALVAVAAGRLGVALRDRQQAQTAADAAALAGVEGGRPAAERLAAANGGELTSFASQQVGDAVTVTVAVTVGGITASARATNGP